MNIVPYVYNADMELWKTWKRLIDWLIDWLIGKSVLRSVGDTSANNGGKGKDLYLAALNMLSPFSCEISIKNSEEIKKHIFNFGILLTFLLADHMNVSHLSYL